MTSIHQAKNVMKDCCLISPKDYLEEYFGKVHFIDVRAPIEYLQASLANSSNMPILENEERHQVGITYKDSGQDAAIELGTKIVSGPTKERRVDLWINEVRSFPHSAVICARGGLRSKISQEWIKQRGVEVPRIIGGYKATRNYLSTTLCSLTSNIDLLLLGGLTGAGKSRLLKLINNSKLGVLDLEKMANHRGSAFGALGDQPSQATFENNLAYSMLELSQNGKRLFLLEAESRSIGKNWIPNELLDLMQGAKCIELNASMPERVENIIEEYICLPLKSFKQGSLEERLALLTEDLSNSVRKISKRLGGVRTSEVLKQLENASALHVKTQSSEHHGTWIKSLLEWYYDPLYSFQSEKMTHQKVFSGNFQEVLEYLDSLQHPSSLH